MAAAGRRSTRRRRDRHPAPDRRQDRRATSRSARFTTMRVGGPADLFATAHNPFELRALVRFARARAIPLRCSGEGATSSSPTAAIRGLVVQVRAEGSRVDGDRYLAEAGRAHGPGRDRDPEGRPDRARVRARDPGHGRRRHVGQRRRPRGRHRRRARVGRRPARGRHGGPSARRGARVRLPRQPVQGPSRRRRPPRS